MEVHYQITHSNTICYRSIAQRPLTHSTTTSITHSTTTSNFHQLLSLDAVCDYLAALDCAAWQVAGPDSHGHYFVIEKLSTIVTVFDAVMRREGGPVVNAVFCVNGVLVMCELCMTVVC